MGWETGRLARFLLLILSIPYRAIDMWIDHTIPFTLISLRDRTVLFYITVNHLLYHDIDIHPRNNEQFNFLIQSKPYPYFVTSPFTIHSLLFSHAININLFSLGDDEPLSFRQT